MHGDLSAYNILYGESTITLIDFPQMVEARHNPHAFELPQMSYQIIVSNQDAPDVQRITASLQDALPATRKVTLTGTAHFPNVEKSAELNQIVLEFRRELP